MYSGSSAIDYLASAATGSDSGESSHWQKYHANFRFLGDGFDGVRGFGGREQPYSGIRRSLHLLMQRRFRSIGASLPDFAAIDWILADMTAKQGRAYDLDVLRQGLTLAFIKARIPDEIGPNVDCCIIGDGFASMTTLLLASGSARTVVLVNLTKTLLVDLWYLKLWMGEHKFESRVSLVTDSHELSEALATRPNGGEGVRVIAIQASDHELLRHCPIDIVLNIASMQEMDPPVISAYFDDLRAIASRRKLHFYCCNREEKRLPDGTVTKFDSYPWKEADEVLVDELCPWHQQYYTLLPPRYAPYDGRIRHRLLLMAE